MLNHNRILVGRIVAPQGIRGEVRVQSFAQNTTDFKSLTVFSDKFTSEDFKFVRIVPDANVIIAKINGINDRNAAKTLRGTDLFVNRDTLPQLKEDEYYQADLIGFDVVRGGNKIGVVDGFQNYGAGDIIELDSGEMVSFIGATVDTENKVIILRY